MVIDPKYLYLDLQKGTLSPSIPTRRTLKDLRDLFADAQTVLRVLESGSDPVIYEIFECLQPPYPGHMNVGTTILYPGKIGKEFYMTKGHYHLKEESSEVYVGLRGDGLILLQSRSGRAKWIRMRSGDVVYVPPLWGHRTVNVGPEELAFLFVYQADAGHDYESIQRQGFSKLVIDKNRTFEVVDNPKFTRNS
jgi:glucose-6-phosphate isomerase